MIAQMIAARMTKTAMMAKIMEKVRPKSSLRRCNVWKCLGGIVKSGLLPH
jgi:hypothetical protein